MPRYTPPVLLDLVFDYDCNLACDYCTITPAMRRRSLSAAALVRQMRAARAEGFDRVSFTGGEPTVRPDLVPLVRKAARLGFEGIKVQSNGLVYAQPANVERLAAAGVTEWHVSIHTHREEAYERLVRRAGTFALMRTGLEHLVARGLAPVADLIVMRSTQAHLADAVDWLADLGVRAGRRHLPGSSRELESSHLYVGLAHSLLEQRAHGVVHLGSSISANTYHSTRGLWVQTVDGDGNRAAHM